jgi:FHA domain
MPAQYLDEYVRELKRDGDATFRSRYDAPVLIVTQSAGDQKLKDDRGAPETTVMADTSGWRIQQVSLLNRVFPLTRGTFAAPGPIALGRTDTSQVAIPDDSISKRHCVFEVGPERVQVTDLGSTNGTSINGTILSPNAPATLRGGETLSVGNFDLLFQTADGFLGYVRKLAGG